MKEQIESKDVIKLLRKGQTLKPLGIRKTYSYEDKCYTEYSDYPRYIMVVSYSSIKDLVKKHPYWEESK